MNTSTWAVLIVVILIILGGGWWYFSTQMPAAVPSTGTVVNSNPNGPDYNPSTTQNSSSTTINVNVNASSSSSAAPMSATVTLTPSGFSPQSVTIKKGGTITWVNQTQDDMWVGSAPHPAHTGYDGTSRTQHCATGYAGATPFDECKAANQYSFTFTKVGTWAYHNHLGAEDFGSITVVE